MKNIFRGIPLIAIALLGGFLTACGGGDTQKSTTAAALDTSLKTADGLTLSTTALMFAGAPIDFIASQTITVTTTNANVNSLQVTLDGDTTTTKWLSASKPVLNNGTATVNVSVFRSFPTLSVGVYNGVVRVAAVGNSGALIAYREVAVQYVLTASTPSNLGTSLVFNSAANADVSPNPKIVTNANLIASDTLVTTYSGAAIGWLSATRVGASPTTLQVSVSPSNTLKPGITYYARLFIIATDWKARIVDVSYTIEAAPNTPPVPTPPNSGNAVLSPATLSYVINGATTESALTQSITVGNAASLAWTALSTSRWLKLTSPKDVNTLVSSGPLGTSTNVNITLVKTELTKLPFGTQTATVEFTFGSDNTATKATLTVTLNMAQPKIDHIAPNVALSNVAGQNVIVRGSGFKVSPVPTQIFLGTTPVAVTNIVSDSELRATLPDTLSKADYNVAFESANNPPVVSRTEATLAVVDQVAYTNQSITFAPGTKTLLKAVYDAQRASILVAFAYPSVSASSSDFYGSVARYTYNASNAAFELYTPSIASSIYQLQDIALSTDGSTLLALTSTSIVPVDPTALRAGAPIALRLSNSQSIGGLKRLAVTNDGYALLTTNSTTQYRYNIRSGMTTALVVNSFYSIVADKIIASGDGSQLYMSTSLSPYSILQYLASTGSVSAVSLNTWSNPGFGVDRFGTRAIFNGYTVYDPSNMTLPLGTLPTSTAGTSVLLSPNGQRAYICCNTNLSTTPATSVPHAYNITSHDPAAGGYAEVTLTTPTIPSSSSPYQMAITADGKALFIVGDTGIAVVATP